MYVHWDRRNCGLMGLPVYTKVGVKRFSRIVYWDVVKGCC